MIEMLFLSRKGDIVMTIYEANNNLIKVGNAMIEEYGLKYYILPRTTEKRL